MAGKNTAAFGIYTSRAGVEEAVDTLKMEGFRNTDISVLFPQNVGSKDFAHQKNTKAPEGVTVGASSGAIVGGALGWLAGVGALAIPGLGPFIAAGPIMAALAGAGVGGAVGGLTGALVGMGIPEYEAKRFEGRVNGVGQSTKIMVGKKAMEGTFVGIDPQGGLLLKSGVNTKTVHAGEMVG